MFFGGCVCLPLTAIKPGPMSNAHGYLSKPQTHVQGFAAHTKPWHSASASSGTLAMYRWALSWRASMAGLLAHADTPADLDHHTF
eukprot:6068469-Amphidinium_carterae.2